MKRYLSCFLFFFCLTAGCLTGLFILTAKEEPEEIKEVQVLESIEMPVLAESEGVRKKENGDGRMDETQVHVVLNQEEVRPRLKEELYCLVAEEGYLIVYDKNLQTVRLFTYMPLADFPVKEQEKLMEGIWFSTMAEIFSYLESYSS